MNISLPRTTEIKISKVQELSTPEGKKFFTKDIVFINEDGHEVKITAFSEDKASLKAK